MKPNPIADKTFAFAIKIVQLYQQLQDRYEFILSKQILRSGTSIGANVQEATAAFSKKDFTYRMSIAAKEARETRYWLKLLKETQLVKMDFSEYLADIKEIDRILTAILKTCHYRNYK